MNKINYSLATTACALLLSAIFTASPTAVSDAQAQISATNSQTTEQPAEIDLVRIPLPVDFEDQTIDWDNVFFGFEGAFVDVIENPDQNEDNPSDFVGRYVKDAEIYWAGAFFWTEDTFWFNEENNTITMDVWSPRANVGINLKLEQSDGSGEFDSFAVTSTSGEWETLTWSYSGVPQQIDWDQLTIIFDFHVGQNGDGGPDWTWYFDNIQVNAAGPDDDREEGPGTPEDLVPISLPQDFEEDDFDWNFAFFGFESGMMARVGNPDPSGINTSDWVGRMIKGSGPFWAGGFMHIDEPFTIDADMPVATMKVWSPRENVPILFKVENQTTGAEYEMISNTTVAGEWEEMSWDLSGAGTTGEWDVIVMIFDFQDGAVGDGGEDFTWFFDDIEVNAEGQPVSIGNPDLGDNPRSFELAQNYPNPFNPTTQIQFQLPEASEVMLEVYNMAGQRVGVLANGSFSAGTHSVSFDAASLASGVYLYRLTAGSFVQTRKMLLVK
ncbi:MAG: T9SS type A sorting domain-containing protein [Balneolia bacterium]|nr:T9SS type A sorting domain-containing protein [Balneolia bacterium]